MRTVGGRYVAFVFCCRLAQQKGWRRKKNYIKNKQNRHLNICTRRKCGRQTTTKQRLCKTWLHPMCMYTVEALLEVARVVHQTKQAGKILNLVSLFSVERCRCQREEMEISLALVSWFFFRDIIHFFVVPLCFKARRSLFIAGRSGFPAHATNIKGHTAKGAPHAKLHRPEMHIGRSGRTRGSPTKCSDKFRQATSRLYAESSGAQSFFRSWLVLSFRIAPEAWKRQRKSEKYSRGMHMCMVWWCLSPIPFCGHDTCHCWWLI